MLKGLALTPPVVGRIAIGKVILQDGKRLPSKDDEFTITTQVQTREGWKLHPLDAALRAAASGQMQEGEPTGTPAKRPAKLRAIPVRLLFNDPELSLRANYSAFDRMNGRPLCVGNGENCKRATAQGIKALPCPSPDGCEFGEMMACKPFGRLNVSLGDKDELGSFIFRTSGFNSIRTLTTRLRYFQALAGDALSMLPLDLRLRGKSTTLSRRTPIYYVDLTLRSGMTIAHALMQARAARAENLASGFDQSALDQAARDGLAQGACEESVEEGPALVDEFYPEPDEHSNQTAAPTQRPASLAAKMGQLVGAPNAS